MSADSDEVSELRWFPFNDVPENLSPPVSEIIREFIRQKKTAILHKKAIKPIF